MSALRRARCGRPTRGRQRERGITIVIIALLITTLFVVAAVVIDLGLVRQNRQADKSATDFAAAAGIRGLDDGSGYVNVWKGICAARDYLVANNAELTPLTHVDSTTGAPISDPCTSPPTVICSGSSTWRSYTGLADGGRIRVRILNGYVLPDPAFPEDATAYADDDGSTTSNGCDHLAVIIDEAEGAYFGGAAGASGYSTTIRSVARLVEGDEGDVTAALVLLERNDCEALDVSGVNARVRIEGNAASPGVIHSDSLGNGSCTGKIFDVNGATPPPRIVVANADSAHPDTGTVAPGLISVVALAGAAGANPSAVSDGVDHVCAEVSELDCGALAPVLGNGPTARNVIGRRRVDERYRLPIVALRAEAAARFAWSTSNPPPLDPVTPSNPSSPTFWKEVGCGDPGPFTHARVWVNCGNFIANDKVFEATVEEVVINGTVSFTGSGKTVHFKAPTTLFIKGDSAGAIRLGSDNRILVNDGALTDGPDSDDFVCDDRYSAAPAARTRMVIGAGDITANGGEMRLCQTTLLMMDNSGTGAFGSGTGPCPIPSVDGVAPYDNGCEGKIRVAGTSRTDWTAPNVKNTPTNLPDATDYANFEDLAFWSETAASSGTGWGVLGSGGVQMSGIYFTPNADPFRIGGGGAYDIEEAQFITRRLEIAGGGSLKMKPDAHNSIRIPVLGGFTLVR